MSPLRVRTLFLLLLLSVHGIAGEVFSSPVKLPLAVEEISPSQAVSYLGQHPETVLLDLRTEEERKTRGHIPNSLHCDYFHTQELQEAVAHLDKTKPCLLYCAIGGRAKLKAVELSKLGFQHVLLLKGGFNAWMADGQKVAP